MLSRLIRWQTRSQYSHASVWFTDGKLLNFVIESIQGRGVREIPGTYHDAARVKEDIHLYEVKTLTLAQKVDIYHYMQKELGKKYDWVHVFMFIWRGKGAHDEKWYCSEIIFEAFRSAGVTLLNNVRAWEVSPGDLGQSPLVTRVPQ